jgi:glucose-6-phosphate isomerase
LSLALSILNDPSRAQTAELAARFDNEHVLARLRSADRGSDAQLARLGDPLWGVVDLPLSAAAPGAEWPAQIAGEIAAIRERIHAAHGTSIRFLIWAGMGGSIEDKSAYEAAGLLKGGPRFYALDSTDPKKLKSIIHDMQERSHLPMSELLQSTLVVGMAMGMTSYEPVVNLEKLAVLFEKNNVAAAANFLCLTLPGSLLDQFAEKQGYARTPIQLDDRNTTAGRHSAPLTRGSLYPLALAGVDLQAWIEAANLSEDTIRTAWKLAAFLHAQGVAGRDKATLLLPRNWSGGALWTKQDFEESLGKSESLGIKIVIHERVKNRFYQKPGNPKQSRCFLAVQVRGESHPEADAITDLRHMKYPIAVVSFPRHPLLATWMQFVHYVVFGLAYLREMNFVTQPSVELYKSIAAEIFANPGDAWKSLVDAQERWTPAVYVDALRSAIRQGATYAELTFFGDMRYDEAGKHVRRILEVAADRVFRMPFKMPVDIHEGPAMNHSYHEMIIGRGACFSTLIAAARQARFPGAGYEPDYHRAQFLATRAALERRGRPVVPLLIKDLEDDSLAALERFFNEVASLLFKTDSSN